MDADDNAFCRSVASSFTRRLASRADRHGQGEPAGLVIVERFEDLLEAVHDGWTAGEERPASRTTSGERETQRPVGANRNPPGSDANAGWPEPGDLAGGQRRILADYAATATRRRTSPLWSARIPHLVLNYCHERVYSRPMAGPDDAVHLDSLLAARRPNDVDRPPSGTFHGWPVPSTGARARRHVARQRVTRTVGRLVTAGCCDELITINGIAQRREQQPTDSWHSACCQQAAWHGIRPRSRCARRRVADPVFPAITDRFERLVARQCDRTSSRSTPGDMIRSNWE